MRIKNVDRTIFHNGFDPLGTSVSHYYATNHYFGHGHWLWMIPTDTQEMELSIGVIHHHEIYSCRIAQYQREVYGFSQGKSYYSAYDY